MIGAFWQLLLFFSAELCLKAIYLFSISGMDMFSGFPENVNTTI
jgi:hypothetical protein